MDGEIPYVYLEAEWYGMNPTQINMPARDPFQLSHQATPY